MAKITEKKVKSPVREANQLEVENKYEAKEEIKLEGNDLIKHDIIEMCKKQSLANKSLGGSDLLSIDSITAILNSILK